jgi:hypothetical protein
MDVLIPARSDMRDIYINILTRFVYGNLEEVIAAGDILAYDHEMQSLPDVTSGNVLGNAAAKALLCGHGKLAVHICRNDSSQIDRAFNLALLRGDIRIASELLGCREMEHSLECCGAVEFALKSLERDVIVKVFEWIRHGKLYDLGFFGTLEHYVKPYKEAYVHDISIIDLIVAEGRAYKLRYFTESGFGTYIYNLMEFERTFIMSYLLDRFVYDLDDLIEKTIQFENANVVTLLMQKGLLKISASIKRQLVVTSINFVEKLLERAPARYYGSIKKILSRRKTIQK